MARERAGATHAHTWDERERESNESVERDLMRWILYFYEHTPVSLEVSRGQDTGESACGLAAGRDVSHSIVLGTAVSPSATS